MDRELLKQYDALKKEQEYLRRQIRRIRSEISELKETRVSDTVTGSRDDLTIGPIKVEGLATRAYNGAKVRLKAQEKRYADSLKKADGILLEIEEGIDSIPDARIRMILRLRYLDGKKWETVSGFFGMSPDWARKAVDGFFSKHDGGLCEDLSKDT